MLAMLSALAMATALQVTVTRNAEIRVDLARPVGTVQDGIYGQFLEHIYHSVVGGLHAEMLAGGSFEEPPRVLIPGACAESGVWMVEGGEIGQTSLEPDTHLWFDLGDAMRDGCALSLEARKDGGDEGFLIIFRGQDQSNFLWWNLGGWGNTASAIEREADGTRTILEKTRTNTTIPPGRWHKIRIEMHGRWTRGFLDGKRLFILQAAEPLTPLIGIGTWQTQASFRFLRLQHLRDARLLWCADAHVGEERAVSEMWEPYSTGKAETAYAWESEDAAVGERCQQVAVRQRESGEHGIRQRGLATQAGRHYVCSLWIRGQWLAEPPVVCLQTPSGAKDEVTVSQLSPQWQRRRFLLQAGETTDDAALSIALRGPGAIWVDGVSLMPADLPEGMPFRADLFEAIKALHPAFIRWPGGCFAERYRWRDGAGPLEARVPKPNDTWGGIDPNTFGTDEFIALCRALGAEPLICLNIGQHEAAADLDAYLSEALEWIEYCNGAASAPMGDLRAANGHRQPYGVRYWEIGNETWPLGAEEYCRRARKFAEAIRARDPDLMLLVCGSGGRNPEWNQAIIAGLGDVSDLISVHHYGGGDTYEARMADALAYVDFLRQTAEAIERSGHAHLRLAVTEWNLMSTALDSGLWAALLLNGCERLANYVTMTSPALLLRNVDAPAWDNALINFDKSGWFPGGNYLTMMMYRSAMSPELGRHASPTMALESQVECARWGSANLPHLDVVATADAQHLILKVVNLNPEEEVETEVVLTGGRVGDAAEMWVLNGERPESKNSLEAPQAVNVSSLALSVPSPRFRLFFAPHSVNVIRVPRLPAAE